VLARLPRLPPAGGGGPPDLVTLVRRARGPGVGLFAQGLGTFGASERELYVIPLDPQTGSPGEALRLGPADFGGKAPTPCDPDADGWLVDFTPPFGQGPTLVTAAGGRVTDLSWRLRLEPGRACADAAVGRVADATTPKAAAPTRPTKTPAPANAPAGTLAIVAEDKSGRRALLRCAPALLSAPGTN
jgi:hypothetical protein